MEEDFCDTCELFKKLYLLELAVCERVSFLILQLGGDPKFYSSTKKFVHCEGIDYVKDLKSVLHLDIELVEKSVVDIKRSLVIIENTFIKENLKELLSVKNEENTMLKNCLIKQHNITKK